MSYCRWSSDNWKCDIYCYEDVSGGFTTYVASNRVVGDVPCADIHLLLEGKNEEYCKAYRAQMDYLNTATRKPIGLPYDGKYFNDKNLQSFLDTLFMLKNAGYNVPYYVIEDVKLEILETKK